MLKSTTHLLVALALAAVAGGCTACDEEPAAVPDCVKDADCGSGLACVQSKCVLKDSDKDGAPDATDNCVDAVNPDQGDLDHDGRGDACDDDRDGDGRPNADDNCPDVANADQADLDRDGQGDACDEDRDGDGVPNDRDNCPNLQNRNQADRDGDRTGDACDSDRDDDGRPNDRDNCPDAENPDQADLDADGIGDACDDRYDDDRDGVPNGRDNCPLTRNPDQKDKDNDGIGDACDDDSDGDGTKDDVDNCDELRNPDQLDTDGDGLGDACDPDLDGDGVRNEEDNCPDLPNTAQEDGDRDGRGDACDDSGVRDGQGTNAECKRKIRRPFTTNVEWRWPGAQVLPAAGFDAFTNKQRDNVMMTPVVADIDADGTPEAAFVAFSKTSNDLLWKGALVMVNGRTGVTEFMVAPAGEELNPAGGIAVANLDNSADNKLELVVQRWGKGLAVFSSAGALLWSCKATANCVDYFTAAGLDWGAPSIADLDADGTAEIVYGATAYKRQANGTYAIWWDKKPAGLGRGDNGVGPLSVVADIDGDGRPEVVTGRTAYRYNGDVYWDNAADPDGFVALGNFDGDAQAEIVVVANATIRLLEHDGHLAWGPYPLPFPTGVTARRGGAPTVADFDGDGFAEVAVATNGMYAVFESDGQLLWKKETEDYSSAATGSSVFDFEGDGWSEVVYNDERYMRVFDGETGQVLYEAPNSTSTAYEYPVIADVDGDDRAEIIVGANPYKGSTTTGVTSYGDPNWVKTRRIWNQHQYSVTNVQENGRVPRVAPSSWKPATFDGWPVGGQGGTYRANASQPPAGFYEPAADLQIGGVDADQRLCSAQVTLRAWVDNRGNADAPAGVEVAVYRGNAAVESALLAKRTTTTVLPPGSGERMAFVLTNLPAGAEILIVADNPDIVPECSSKANNFRSALGVACE